jgi:DUF4097 and DUF4098 domain-containing protein YvlB
MKKSFFIALIAAQAFCINAQNREPFLTKSFSNSSVKSVVVETTGGNISVTGENKSDARVEVYVHKNNNRDNDLSKDEIQKRLDEDYNLNISVDNGKLTAVAKPKHNNMNWKKALSISFRVFTPVNVSTDLSTSGGNIELSNVSGKQNFSTSGGNLQVNNVTENLKGRTSGGNIDVSNCKDEIDLRTSGGNIEASNCTGNIRLETSGGSLRLDNLNGNVKANTSGGNVRGNDISGGELFAHTSGGNIDLQGLSSSLETSTSGGNIDVSIKQLSKYVKISNSGGNIAIALPKNKGIDLDLSGKIGNTHFENFDGKVNEHEVSGKLNGGGIPVTVDAEDGRIHLSFN